MKKNTGVRGFELATYLHAHQKQACTLLYTCVACFFFLGWDVALCCRHVPRMCRLILCPILLLRTWYHVVFSCDNNSVFNTLH